MIEAECLDTLDLPEHANEAAKTASLQHLDLLSQSLTVMAEFLQVVAKSDAAAAQADLSQVLGDVRLEIIRHILSGAPPPANAPRATGRKGIATLF